MRFMKHRVTSSRAAFWGINLLSINGGGKTGQGNWQHRSRPIRQLARPPATDKGRFNRGMGSPLLPAEHAD